MENYDVIVVGAGHAGCESALAAARIGCRTLMLTLNIENVALMPCNPSIGGPAKGHLVREIDALGGEIGVNIDKTLINIRMLNTSKGPAVRALRAQADKKLYQHEMKRALMRQEGLDLKQGLVTDIIAHNGKVEGVRTIAGDEYRAKTVIVTTGTFLNGLIHIGEVSYPAGRQGEFPSIHLSDSLRKLGLELGRLKTGTVPRLDARTIDYSRLKEQRGDEEPLNFSFTSPIYEREQVSCWLTYTTKETRDIILRNLHRSPLYGGKIKGIGPRYCPSIEDKIVRFADKETHHAFLEPEGITTNEVYLQGIATSLPADVQLDMVHSIIGLENAEIMRWGYAIEYDFVFPTQLKPTLETKKISGLFLAGQVNGTSGYEEAGGQGIMAGINAALKVRRQEPLILDRSQAYIGVLIDDLVTKGTKEPYRMFTSRAEYRLLLRQDNADLRLTPIGYKIGLIPKERYRLFLEKREILEKQLDRLGKISLKPEEEVQSSLRSVGSSEIRQAVRLSELLRRPEISYELLSKITSELPSLPRDIIEELEIQIKYDGYIKRELQQVERFKKLENRGIPDDIDYDEVYGLSTEARQKLKAIRPISIGQAQRISGISPSDISVLMIYLERRKRSSQSYK